MKKKHRSHCDWISSVFPCRRDSNPSRNRLKWWIQPKNRFVVKTLKIYYAFRNGKGVDSWRRRKDWFWAFGFANALWLTCLRKNDTRCDEPFNIKQRHNPMFPDGRQPTPQTSTRSGTQGQIWVVVPSDDLVNLCVRQRGQTSHAYKLDTFHGKQNQFAYKSYSVSKHESDVLV